MQWDSDKLPVWKIYENKIIFFNQPDNDKSHFQLRYIPQTLDSQPVNYDIAGFRDVPQKIGTLSTALQFQIKDVIKSLKAWEMILGVIRGKREICGKLALISYTKL
jgi:hypothetical protein